MRDLVEREINKFIGLLNIKEKEGTSNNLLSDEELLAKYDVFRDSYVRAKNIKREEILKKYNIHPDYIYWNEIDGKQICKIDSNKFKVFMETLEETLTPEEYEVFR